MKAWVWFRENILLIGPNHIGMRGAKWRMLSGAGYGWLLAFLIEANTLPFSLVTVGLVIIGIGEYRTIKAQDEHYRPTELWIFGFSLLAAFLFQTVLTASIALHGLAGSQLDVTLASLIGFVLLRSVAICIVHYRDQWFGGGE